MGRAGKVVSHVSSTVVPEDYDFQSVIEASSERLVPDAHRRAVGSIHVAITDARPIASAYGRR
jgi:hypothetical protein